jgi:pimeloyl-ACP methyl ester carboxylesterase
LNPAPGSVRYRRYRADSIDAARRHAEDDGRYMLAEGWVAYAETWDEAGSTLVRAYSRGARARAPYPPVAASGAVPVSTGAGTLSRNLVLATLGLAVVVVVAGSVPRLFDPARSGTSPSPQPQATVVAGQRSSSPSASTGPGAASPTPAAVPRFEQTTCRSQWIWHEGARCGELIVLEDRAKPNGRRISLHVAILPSYGMTSRPDPVIYLAGGPGGSALRDGFSEFAFTGERELIVFDQRGVGLSDPALECSDLVWVILQQTEADGLRRCRERQVGKGIELASFNTTASAADVEDLRRVLGYEQVNLYGISYGSRLALEVMRRHPAGVRSVILDSVYPMGADIYADGAINAQRAFDTLFAGCAADDECRAAYPDLESHFYDLVDRLERTPYKAASIFGLGGSDVDGEMLIQLLFNRMYVTWNLAGLPASLETFWRGELGELDRWVEELLFPGPPLNLLGISVGAYYSVQCAESLPFIDNARLGTVDPGVKPVVAGAMDWQYLIDNCAAWDVPPAPAEFNRPVVSDIPTLLFAGTYDPITPPAWAERAADTLSASHVVIVPGMGHGVVDVDWCIQGIVERFLDRPADAVRAGCVADLGPVDHLLATPSPEASAGP